MVGSDVADEELKKDKNREVKCLEANLEVLESLQLQTFNISQNFRYQHPRFSRETQLHQTLI